METRSIVPNGRIHENDVVYVEERMPISEGAK